MKRQLCIIAGLLSLVMIFTALLPAAADVLSAVEYYDYDDESKAFVKKEISDYTLIDSDRSGGTFEGGWYVADGEVNVSGRIICEGTELEPVRIILTDGCKLTVSGGIGNDDGNYLYIYGQQNGTGILEIENAPENCAGIGGSEAYKGCGPIVINGGKITAAGGENSAGIGGSDLGEDVYITINGGEVTATGGFNGAGIGTGCGSVSDKSGKGAIIINGGIVTATGGYRGAGIGRAYHGFPNKIFINGGKVTAYGEYSSAGIGGGKDTNGAEVVISGGEVTAVGGLDSKDIGVFGIGGGSSSSGHGKFTISGDGVYIVSGNSEDDALPITTEAYNKFREHYVKIVFISDAKYQVNHRVQSTDGTEYTTFETETLSAKAGSMTSATFKAYPGFTPVKLEQLVVSADGSTVVNVLYDRLAYKLFFDANGHGIAPQPIKALYGAELTEPDAPQADGFVFGGWFEDAACTKAYAFDFMPLDGMVIYAKWSEEEPTEPEEPTTPTDPTEPGENTPCSKCGKTHTDDFFGKIACFIYRIINFFNTLF